MVKKLLVAALAVVYLVSADCRFACALGMAAAPHIVAEQHDQDEHAACHHHQENSGAKHQHPGPCCVGHSDGTALLPSQPAIVSSIIVVELPAPAAGVQASSVDVRAYAANHDPPRALSEVLEQSVRSPRAPPFLPVVL